MDLSGGRFRHRLPPHVRDMPTPALVVVCVKWAPPHIPAETSSPERFAGMSPADQAALELALRTGEVTGDDVVVVTAGPTEAEKILREALACGAARALRVDTPPETSSVDAAAAVSRALADLGEIRIVWCGDYSSDRGTGSFPAFLAAHLGLEQSLGLIRVDFAPAGFPLEIVRRLDGGRRERSFVRSCAVLSVEGSLATLRRASLSRTLAVRSTPIDVVVSQVPAAPQRITRPYRPRARVIDAPTGSTPLDRIRSVTESSAPKGSSDPIELEPSEAARLILDRLRDWGYTQ